MELNATARDILSNAPTKVATTHSPQVPTSPSAQKNAPTTASPQETSQLSPKGQSAAQLSFVGDPFSRAYDGLNAQQKQAFETILNHSIQMPGWLAQSAEQDRQVAMPGPWVQQVPTKAEELFTSKTVSFLSPKEQQIFKDLLANGTLMRKSSDGQTILSHLSALLKDDKNKQTNGPQLVRDLIRMLQAEDMAALKAKADKMTYHVNDKGQNKQDGIPMPGGLGEITQCPTHYTCGAASMQVWMRLNRPEELVRITHDLVSKGESKLNGSTLKPARGSLDYHAGDTIYKHEVLGGKAGVEDRCDLDIILQSAFMNKVAIGNWSEYDVNSDSGEWWNMLDGNSGGHPLYMAREMERLSGQPFEYSHNLSLYGAGAVGRFFTNLEGRTEQSQLVQELKKQVSAGKHVMIAYQTRPNDAMALHFVTVTGYDPKTDQFYYADTDETKATRAKMYTKTTQDMQDVLRCVIYPK